MASSRENSGEGAGGKSTPLSILHVAAVALIDTRGRILLARRPAGKAMAGLWEFPGGKLEDGETPEAALVRELAEELGIIIEPADLSLWAVARHDYADFHLHMPLYLCRRWQGTPRSLEAQALAWVLAAALQDYPMPAADQPLVTSLVRHLQG